MLLICTKKKHYFEIFEVEDLGKGGVTNGKRIQSEIKCSNNAGTGENDDTSRNRFCSRTDRFFQVKLLSFSDISVCTYHNILE